MHKVMAVDDEIWVLRGLKKQLELASARFELTQAHTQPLQALSALEREPVDLVFVDIQMPGINGLQFIDRARQICPRAIFVIMSAYSEFGYAQQAIRLGVEAYLIKPVTQADLEALLHSVCQQLDKMALERWDGYAHRFLMMNAKRMPSDVLMKELGFAQMGNFCCWATYRRLDPSLALIRAVLQICAREGAQSTAFNSEDGQFYLALACAPELVLERIRLVLLAGAEQAGLHGGISGIISQTEQLGEAVLSAQWGALQHFVNPDAGLVEVSQAQPQVEMMLSDYGLLERMPMSHIVTQIRDWSDVLVSGREPVFNVFCQVNAWIQFLLKRAYSPRLRELMMLMSSPVSMVEGFGSARELTNALVECALAHQEDEPRQAGVEQVRAYLVEHCGEPLLIGQVAAHFAMDAGYLGRLFRQKQGIGIKEYLNLRRMERAGDLLKSTSLSVQEIANLCGMPDYFYFSKVFKKHFSMPPAQYRTANNHKKADK